MKNFIALMLSMVFTLAYSSATVAEPQFLRSALNLEDPRGYCLDIPGFGPRMRKDAPVTTHSCKYSIPGFWVDELFEMTDSGQLRLPEYDLCLSAESQQAGSYVNTIDCSEDTVHAWTVESNGHVSPANASDLCLTLSSDRTYVNSAPANLTPYSSRSVSLENCNSDLEDYQSWKFADPSGQKTQTANTLREGMDAATARGIRELGNEIRPPETFALYANQSRMFTAADVTVSDEIHYGPDEGQQLQVYSGNNRNNPQNAAPIILLVHGGGFARGDLNSFTHLATQFAGLGYIAVNMTYPLAPAASWPSGAQSVAGAVGWIKENAAEIKGNPDNIFVLGASAGGAHVADFVFRPGVVGGESPEVAGVILSSPVLVVNSENPPQSSYFGEDADAWQGMQTLGNIERTSIPVLTMVAEFDPDQFKTSTAQLLNELLVDKGVNTRISQMRGHNHISYLEAIGTSDTQALQEILDFIATAGRD
ncbi:MAG: alpha/beta hydrolase fold domain-containing protein [Proteobacteria bacterium]|jgi:acetyl esterase|nr:alpha/beta hydrolase fold domain-containing protein [Pseudomonadota bacterium]